MPGFNNQQLKYQVQSGNSVVVLLGDEVIAYCQTSRNTVDFGTEFLYGIGTAKPEEIQQLRFAPTITVTSFLLTKQGITALNYPSTLLGVLANNSFNMSVVDADGNTLFTYIGCVCNTYDQTVPVNSIITQDLSFNALDVLDQTGISVLNGPFALGTIANAVGAVSNTIGL